MKSTKLIFFFLLCVILNACSDEPSSIKDIFKETEWYSYYTGHNPEAADYWLIKFHKNGTWEASAHHMDGSEATNYLKYNGGFSVDWDNYKVNMTTYTGHKTTAVMILKDNNPKLYKDIGLQIQLNSHKDGFSGKTYGLNL